MNDLKNKTDDSKTLSDCKAVLNKMLTYEFIVATNMWYKILLHVNNISKLCQSIQVNLKVAVDTFVHFVFGFKNSMILNLRKAAQMLDCLWKKDFEVESQLKEKGIA